jgi:predicted DNA-binding transcriptional regulator AlpA
MSSKISAPDVVGVTEVARLLGLSKGRVSQLRSAGVMPPAADLASGPVWRRKHIEEWARDRGFAF